jgi:voltage-gated sodium channel type IV alpha
LFVVLLGPFYLINLVLAVVSLSYEIESANLQDEEAMKKNYETLKRSASAYDFDCKEMPEPLYLDDIPQRPEESKYAANEAEPRPPSRNTATPTSDNALELGENYEAEAAAQAGCCTSFRAKVNKIVDSPLFEGFITACILLNTVCMALEHHNMDETLKMVLGYCNLVGFTHIIVFLFYLNVTGTCKP